MKAEAFYDMPRTVEWLREAGWKATAEADGPKPLGSKLTVEHHSYVATSLENNWSKIVIVCSKISGPGDTAVYRLRSTSVALGKIHWFLGVRGLLRLLHRKF